MEHEGNVKIMKIYLLISELNKISYIEIKMKKILLILIWIIPKKHLNWNYTVSELKNKFYIELDKDVQGNFDDKYLQASDYDCFDMLYKSISNHIHETM